MRSKIKEYFFKVMRGERVGLGGIILFPLLTFLSFLYYLLLKLVFFLYKEGVLTVRKLPCPVISVGNIVLGGTGKTPVALLLVEKLRKEGKKVGILSRGYGGSYPGMGIVSDGRRIYLDHHQVGDEPYLIASSLNGVPVATGQDRFATGSYLVVNYGIETIVLDDGFQYWSLKRDLEIVLIDSTEPFGNGYLFPRGMLREPLKNLSRAHLFILTRADQVSNLERLKGKIRNFNPQAPILECVHQPLFFYSLKTEERYGLDSLKGKRVLALSGIGNPRSFEATLQSLGPAALCALRYQDHYRYRREDLGEILRVALRENIECIVTTEKDAVRLKDLYLEEGNIWVLVVKAKITKGEEELDRILKEILEKKSKI